ncbi:MAG TPA: nucleotidyltransferase domain-containing protein [Thermoplasmata archaeon]|jgi:predicted nucleotidyltransferase|nr:nucleotidyltransferase domain-containing protein [Thermoplasmata archaeon]
MNHRAVAEAFARRLKGTYADRIDRIVLFGSVARGDHRPDSDVDLLIVTRGDRLVLQENVARDAIDVLLREGIVVTPLVVTASEAAALAGTGLGRELAREGLAIA